MKYKFYQNMINTKENKQGVTLISLVVTVIVLIILAGVSLNVVLGDNGLIAMAKKRQQDIDQEIIDDQQRLNELHEQSASGSGWKDTEPTNPGGSGGTGGGTDTPVPPTIDKLEDALDSKTTFQENKQLKDENGDIMWIPKGFTIIDGPTIDEGIVVKDGAENEFVWVPVEDITSIYDEANDAGQMYNYSRDSSEVTATKAEYSVNKGDEPSLCMGKTDSKFDAESKYFYEILGFTSSSQFERQMEKEFNAMIESVKRYKGFYIGRYETGNLQSNDSVPVVQRNRRDISYVRWYWIYKNSKNVANEESSVVSSMIWGCQWYATINWLISCGGSAKKYVENETSRRKLQLFDEP